MEPRDLLGILCNPRYAQMSTYTPKTAQGDSGRSSSWRAQILRDDAGELIRGQRVAIIDVETWWRAQSILDDAECVTNTSGSTKHKYLGSGLYRCGICGAKVTGASHGHCCAQHVERDEDGTVLVLSIMRSGAQIDSFVTALIAEQLRQSGTLCEEASTGSETIRYPQA